MILKAIYEDCGRRNKNLSTALIDYQKELLLLLLLLLSNFSIGEYFPALAAKYSPILGCSNLQD